jgi:hypothetical protein
MSIREKAKVSNKLRKEEKLHLKEERQAFDANKEFPLWKVVDYDLQTEEFFHSVRELPNEGLNPKLDLTAKHVSKSNIAKVFGGKGIKPFKTTNSMLHPATKMTLFSLCWKIYGSALLPNNEFMAWIVKGYVVQQKGLFKVNWAVAVASTVVEEKCRDLVLLGKVNASKTMSTDLTEGTCTGRDFSTRSVKDVDSKGLGLQIGSKQVQASSLYPTHSRFVIYDVEL